VNPVATGSHTTDGTGMGSFTSNITGLTLNTKYYVRAYATNSVGTAYGDELSFTTNAATTVVPTLSTTAIYALASKTVNSGGNITDEGGAAVTVRGVCWSTSASPTVTDSKTVDGSGSGSFISALTGLTPNTTYNVRAYATNSAGTAFGNQVTFTTTIQVTDYDGNIYNTVKISNQLWTQENLKVLHFRNGDAIPNVTDGTAWSGLTTGAYCNYKNDISYITIYGRSYNSYATIDNRNLCPAGWHVPTDSEWDALEASLIANGYNYDGSTTGNKIGKSIASSTGWDYSSVTGAVGNTDYPDFRNKSGFTGLAAGFRDASGSFDYQGMNYFGMGAVWWTTTESDPNSFWSHSIFNMGESTGNGADTKSAGFSVRCMQGEGQVLPAVTTVAISALTSTTASSGGNITSDGGATITERGVCWNTAVNPTIANTKITDGATGTGSFVSYLTGLTASTTYYLRAYATNSVGTAYGNELSFTTPSTVPGAPTIGTATAGNTQATVAFTAPASDGGSAITGYTVTSSPGSITGTGSLSPITVTSLANGTTYTFTVTATNANGTGPASSASNSVTPSTVPGAPTIGTATAGNTQATVTFTAPVSNGGSAITGYTVTSNPESKTGTGSASPVTVTGLTNGTAYIFTVTATNANGTGPASSASNSVTPSLLSIGDSYQGGIIAYILQPGDPGYVVGQTYGIIAAPGDQSTGAEWGCYNTTITGADGTAIGTGNQNTTDIMAGCSTAGIAARLCGDLVLGGYSDWYLPSKDELDKLYVNRIVIGGFADVAYWSSSENSISTAWYRNFYNGGQYIPYKNDAGSVRAVRAFPPAPVFPAVSTTAVSAITSTTATSGGNVLSDGGAPVTARGVCWSTSSGPTIALPTKTSNGNGTGTFTSSITGLSLGWTYFVRAYATNSAGTAYGNEISFTTSTLAIGDSYQGGIVAYILQSGDPGYIAGQTHGLIAAPSDQSISATWWNGSNTTTGATGTALGTGQTNTTAIILSQGNTGSYAAKICQDLVLGVYSDWYLPSKGELNKLYLNKAAIGGFTSGDYWSSTEFDNSNAWRQYFYNGVQDANLKNGANYYVRAVQAF
jgi:uncharacterized protein (TIGR02145 family)